MPTAEEKLLAAIKSHGKGWCFTARDFLHLKDTEAVWKGLVRLEKKGLIRRLGRGLYDYPREHPELGKLAPTPEAVAQALAERDGSRLQPSGAYAANLLGLSEQVPARIVFLTSGPDRKIKIGKREIILKHTVPRNMATAGRISGTIIQALRHIGEDQIGDDQIALLRSKLGEADRRQLLKDRLHAPAWLRPILIRLTRTEPLEMTTRDSLRVLELLENPPAPNPRLLTAARDLPPQPESK